MLWNGFKYYTFVLASIYNTPPLPPSPTILLIKNTFSVNVKISQ